jgi:hypothetical protein
MGRCKNCKWWKPQRTELCEQGAGRCDLTVVRSDWFSSELMHPSSLAWASGNDGAQDSLLTKADFGCVQFEASEPTSG